MSTQSTIQLATAGRLRGISSADNTKQVIRHVVDQTRYRSSSHAVSGAVINEFVLARPPMIY